MIHVIIPVFNRIKYTIKCLTSLKNQINYNQLNIIVVNDGSTDNTKKYLEKNFKDIIILNGNGSLYWGGAVNLGVEYVKTISKKKDLILLLNNDVILLKDSVFKLFQIVKENKRKVIAGSLAINIKDKQSIIKSGTIVKNWFFNNTHHIFVGKKINNIANINSVNVDFITGRCLLHPIEIFSIVGNYDSKNFPHYGCDDEFSMRVKKFDFKTLLCPISIIYLDVKDKFFFKRKNNFIKTFFHIKSSSNIINKFKLTLKVVPVYAKLTFFLISIVKSFIIFLKK